MEISDVLRVEEVRTIFVFDVPKNATLRLKGRVLGGFDLDKGFDVSAMDASAPASCVYACAGRQDLFLGRPSGSSSQKLAFLNPITPDDRTRWTSWARAALAKSAKDAGLYDAAARHAREVFSDAAAAFGWTAEVTVGGKPVPAFRDPTPGP